MIKQIKFVKSQPHRDGRFYRVRGTLVSDYGDSGQSSPYEGVVRWCEEAHDWVESDGLAVAFDESDRLVIRWTAAQPAGDEFLNAVEYEFLLPSGQVVFYLAPSERYYGEVLRAIADSLGQPDGVLKLGDVTLISAVEYAAGFRVV